MSGSKQMRLAARRVSGGFTPIEETNSVSTLHKLLVAIVVMASERLPTRHSFAGAL
jgi:hypothetical protein